MKRELKKGLKHELDCRERQLQKEKEEKEVGKKKGISAVTAFIQSPSLFLSVSVVVQLMGNISARQKHAEEQEMRRQEEVKQNNRGGD